MMFLYSSWLKLPITTRVQIADAFGILKKGSTEVFDNRIINDGYIITEVEGALNIDALQKYLAVEITDMALLWDMLLARIEGRLYEPPVVPQGEVVVLDIVDEVTEVPTKKPFCDSCDSKGVRHKKVCPKRNQ